jgi:hypothetical protein
MLGGGGLDGLAPALEPYVGPQASALAISGSVDEIALVEPLHFAPHVDPERVVLMRAIWDPLIPTASADRLRSALGMPTEYAFPSGHFSFALFLPIAMRLVDRHAAAWCSTTAPAHE